MVSCAVDPAVAFNELLRMPPAEEEGIPSPTPTIDDGVTLVSVMMMVPLFETGKVWALEPRMISRGPIRDERWLR
jgi:hypothetical protein